MRSLFLSVSVCEPDYSFCPSSCLQFPLTVTVCKTVHDSTNQYVHLPSEHLASPPDLTGVVEDTDDILGEQEQGFVGCLLACLTSQQHASVSQGRICSDNCTCCHTGIQVVDPTFHLTQSQYTDTGSTSPSIDPLTPGRVVTGVPILKSLV